MKPNIVAQRFADNTNDHLLTAYYHWIKNGVDFWNLDTAAGMQVRRAQTDAYGYSLVTVAAGGSITVDFREVKRGDVPPDVEQTFGTAGVDKCYGDNRDETVAKSANCVTNVPCAMP